MKTKRILSCLFAALLLLAVCAPVGMAGITGKIRGVVRDARSGEPLPGANVILKGTNMGAATDAEGNYIILHIPAGVYAVEVRMIGYTTSIKTSVQVLADRTVNLNFKLKESVLQAEEVVVVAERDLIQLDVAATQSFITEKEYKTTPFANRIEDVLAMQSGVTGNLIEGEIKIREGDYYEVGVLVDGFSTVDPKFNRPIIAISPGVVQEINVMRNGFNAEYGQSQSGVINIVTKNPSDRYRASFDYQFSPARRRHFGPDIYDPEVFWPYRLYDGPNSMQGDSLFLYEGRHVEVKEFEGWIKRAEELNSDANPDNDLTAEEARELWRWRHRPIEYGNQTGHTIDASLSGPVKLVPWNSSFLLGIRYESRPFTFPQSRNNFDDRNFTLKLNNNLSSNAKLTLFGTFSKIKTVATSFGDSNWRNEDRISYDGGGTERFYPFRRPLNDRSTTLLGSKFLQTFSPTFFVEFNMAYFNSDWNERPASESPAEAGRVFGSQFFLDPQAGWIPRDKGVDDIATSYRLYGGANTDDNSFSRRFEVNFALTNQFHRNHELKAGVAFKRYDLNEDRVHLHDDDPTQMFTWRYHVKPYEFSAYLQDKIEFKGMIANIGLRWDYYNTNSERPDVLRVLEQQSDATVFEALSSGTFPMVRVAPKHYVSPRIGVSFPLTESSKIYFNYGHFVQMPNNEGLYANTLDSGRPRVQWMGNPYLDFQKTIAYELGYDQNFRDLFQLHIGAYYKDYHDVINGMVFAHSNQSLILEWPDQRFYKEISGIEIEVRKAVGRYLSGFFNFNVTRKSEANLEVPRFDSCCPIITDDPNVGINGELAGVPRPNITSITPYGRGVVTLTLPRNWGPKLSDYSIFGNTAASFRIFYTGRQRIDHPSEQFRRDHPHVEFKTIPFYKTDLRLSRQFNMFENGLELYFDVSNLWVSKYRNIPGHFGARVDYFNDLFERGKTDKVGSEDVSDPILLRTESKSLYRGEFREYILGIRYSF